MWDNPTMLPMHRSSFTNGDLEIWRLSFPVWTLSEKAPSNRSESWKSTVYMCVCSSAPMPVHRLPGLQLPVEPVPTATCPSSQSQTDSWTEHIQQLLPETALWRLEWKIDNERQREVDGDGFDEKGGGGMSLLLGAPPRLEEKGRGRWRDWVRDEEGETDRGGRGRERKDYLSLTSRASTEVVSENELITIITKVIYQAGFSQISRFPWTSLEFKGVTS